MTRTIGSRSRRLPSASLPSAIADSFNLVAPLQAIACFDYEQDGDVDIIINPVEGSVRLYKYQLNGEKNWLAVILVGLSGNTEAFGAKVTLYTSAGKQYREVHFENNYLSRSSSRIHFGLGKETQVEFSEPEINPFYIVSQTQKSK
jgi:hypothetical protein